jgi:hypothetical protein
MMSLCEIDKGNLLLFGDLEFSSEKKAPKVPWWQVVWFPLAIPRHAFVLWLVCRNALTTKERIVDGFYWKLFMSVLFWMPGID